MLHALDYATRHRKLKKRQNRALAITRINAAAREHGISYSALINALSKANIVIDRKSLAELAIREPSAFAKVVDTAKTSL
jgi:large subunit ribosomal protein L20